MSRFPSSVDPLSISLLFLSKESPPERSDGVFHFSGRNNYFYPFTNWKKTAIIFRLSRHAPVAQWIEHRIPVPRVGGSSPFRRTKKADTQMGVCFFGISEEWTRKAGPGAAGVKNSPVDTCLARGRVPGFPDASGTDVDKNPEPHTPGSTGSTP